MVYINRIKYLTKTKIELLKPNENVKDEVKQPLKYNIKAKKSKKQLDDLISNIDQKAKKYQ